MIQIAAILKNKDVALANIDKQQLITEERNFRKTRHWKRQARELSGMVIQEIQSNHSTGSPQMLFSGSMEALNKRKKEQTQEGGKKIKGSISGSDLTVGAASRNWPQLPQ